MSTESLDLEYFPPEGVLEEVLDRCCIAYDPTAQDWYIEFGDAHRVGDFIEMLGSMPTTEHDKVLLAIVICSLDSHLQKHPQIASALSAVGSKRSLDKLNLFLDRFPEIVDLYAGADFEICERGLFSGFYVGY